MEKKIGAFSARQFSLGTLVGGTIFKNPGGGGGARGGRIQGPDPAAPPPPPRADNGHGVVSSDGLDHGSGNCGRTSDPTQKRKGVRRPPARAPIEGPPHKLSPLFFSWRKFVHKFLPRRNPLRLHSPACRRYSCCYCALIVEDPTAGVAVALGWRQARPQQGKSSAGHLVQLAHVSGQTTCWNSRSIQGSLGLFPRGTALYVKPQGQRPPTASQAAALGP